MAVQSIKVQYSGSVGTGSRIRVLHHYALFCYDQQTTHQNSVSARVVSSQHVVWKHSRKSWPPKQPSRSNHPPLVSQGREEMRLEAPPQTMPAQFQSKIKECTEQEPTEKDPRVTPQKRGFKQVEVFMLLLKCVFNQKLGLKKTPKGKPCTTSHSQKVWFQT